MKLEILLLISVRKDKKLEQVENTFNITRLLLDYYFLLTIFSALSQ